jgi:hypothetical protein
MAHQNPGAQPAARVQQGAEEVVGMDLPLHQQPGAALAHRLHRCRRGTEVIRRLYYLHASQVQPDLRGQLPNLRLAPEEQRVGEVLLPGIPHRLQD